jgi:hypothetical protein
MKEHIANWLIAPEPKMPEMGAQDLIEYLVRAVSAPSSVTNVLREREPKSSDDTNWATATGVLPVDSLSRYDRTLVELRKQHPRVDWDGVTEREGQWRRIDRSASEVLWPAEILTERAAFDHSHRYSDHVASAVAPGMNFRSIYNLNI